MLLAIALVLANTLPSASRTAWMDPAAFHLQLNMRRADVTTRLESRGWKVVKGKDKSHLVIHYDEKKTVTLGFFNGRLHSMRFELVDFAPEIRAAFSEREEALKKKLGTPSKQVAQTMLVYEKTKPNVFVVMSVDAKTDYGRQGLGFLVVRYFDPAAGG